MIRLCRRSRFILARSRPRKNERPRSANEQGRFLWEASVVFLFFLNFFVELHFRH